MNVLEVVLLLAGMVIFTLSFLIPAARAESGAETKKIAKEEIKSMVSEQMEEIRSHVDDVVDEAVGYAVEKTERSLERLTNEKIMAVNEYSDTVLQEIHRNHEEVMFLYDMLNDKHTNLKSTVSEAAKTAKEVSESTSKAEAVVSSFQKLTPEVVSSDTAGTIRTVADTPKEQQDETAAGTKKRKTGGTTTSSVTKTRKEQTSETARTTEEQPDIRFGGGEEDGRNNNERILELHKAGKSNVAIAKELGLGVGEVKLVIDLFRNM